MEFEDQAIVLGSRAHGETGAIVDFLTASHGRWAAHVAGGASRRLKPVLQPGAAVLLRYRARTADQLGAGTIEADGPGVGDLLESPLALAGISAAAAVTAGALPEREPHSGAFAAFSALRVVLMDDSLWPTVYVKYEAGLLSELGFGLDLDSCAVTGATENLTHVSPRTGRAVCAEAAEPYLSRLLPLPPFLLRPSAPRPGDVGAGLDLTGHFLETHVFAPLHQPLPPARFWMRDRLSEKALL
jgi:DNA repair protein RecO (recombination protein O)